jgi:hypothetical protein
MTVCNTGIMNKTPSARQRRQCIFMEEIMRKKYDSDNQEKIVRSHFTGGKI